MNLLSLDRLTVRRGGRVVVDSVDLEIGAGECVGLLGPNGAGKTSLMRAALGLLAFEGSSDIAALPPAARARRVAFLPQSRDIAWPVRVRDLVAFGLRESAPRARAEAVGRVLARLRLEDLRDRPATELSGGERARVLLARALAQETPLLVADEPNAGLDPAHQITTMQLFARLAAEGRGVLLSLHDLGLALRHTTRCLLLDRGRLVADGPPREVLTPANLARTFGIEVVIVETAHGPILQPIGVA